MKKRLRQLCLVVMTVLMVGTVFPATQGFAKERTTPTSFRGEWFHVDGEVPLYLKITKHTLKITVGMYYKGRWGNKQDKTLKLAKKVKKNKTFTISKKNKAGYRTVRLNNLLVGGKNGFMLLKVKKGKHQSSLIDRRDGARMEYHAMTKAFIKKNFSGYKF